MNVIRMEEQVLAGDRRMQDKMQECAALGRELDAARDEGSRAVLRANQRADAVRKSVPRRRQAQTNKQLFFQRSKPFRIYFQISRIIS